MRTHQVRVKQVMAVKTVGSPWCTRALQLIAAASTLCNFYPTLTLTHERWRFCHWFIPFCSLVVFIFGFYWKWGVRLKMRRYNSGAWNKGSSISNLGSQRHTLLVRGRTSSDFKFWSCLLNVMPSMDSKSFSLSRTPSVVEDSGLDEPTPAMMLIAYAQGTMSVAGASHQEVPNLIVQ